MVEVILHADGSLVYALDSSCSLKLSLAPASHADSLEQPLVSLAMWGHFCGPSEKDETQHGGVYRHAQLFGNTDTNLAHACAPYQTEACAPD